MAQFDGTITRFEFHPMVDIVPSILHFWVYVPALRREISFQEEGAITLLSAKFKFKIVSDNEWDFTGLEGRNCRIWHGEDGTKFLGLTS